MTDDVLPAVLMKKAKNTLDIVDEFEDESRELNGNELWLPVSAVTEWQQKIVKAIGSLPCWLCEEGISHVGRSHYDSIKKSDMLKVLGVKP